MRAYELAESASPWLGAVPSHWRVSRFGYEASVNGGQVDPRDEPWASTVLVAPNHIESGTGRILGRETASEQGADSGKYLARAGQILYSKIRPALNKVTIAVEDCLCSADMYAMSFRPSVVPRYALYYMLARPFNSFTTVTSMRVKMPKINREELAAGPWLVPPSDEQQAIVKYLDRETTRIDTLINEQQRLIAMLRERRASVIDSALTPAELWDRRRIKYIGQTNLGKMLDAGRAVRDGDRMRPYVRAADVRADGSVNLVDLNSMSFSDAEMEFFDLRAGDVLLIEGGATVGRPGFVFDSVPGIAFQKTVNRLRVGEQADPRFVYWSMLRLYDTAYYANHFGAVSFVHLTGEKLREIELRLPPLDKQRAIATHLDDQTAKIDSLIAETERFIELSRERRSALITAAVTGQIDVREVA
ncbi:restriction endonuclease subunit S [Streptomyces sp. NPDC091259]|uniref:restriction endonuclease subunit S n=1 Tax=Streptomyces sp. NPDC091259 TaxID=3365976 RepID=UPI003801A710